MTQEWDWPPPRRRSAPSYEGRIERETVVIPKPRRATPTWPNRAADAYFRVVLFCIKIIGAVALTGIILACVWFVSALLKAA